ncbi:LANO_0G05292g1_1 [Lachancea nothofagi CBS 11611]|uniref:LANO_0G05292g1_1 n=1 Tax=Lachancea nothofagi CBS 11611 TaxID=1266666 RepID=A0A1G4KGC8_9SACH|nr:LANO_0G05292g1_1 [Lachancea nothofagi CBS 11611]
MILLKRLIWLLQVCNIACGAGVGVHLTMLARTSIPWELKPYISEMKAGTFFPDAFYSCAANTDWQEFAEKTHWPPFLVLGAKLWRETYGTNQNCEDSLKLKGFLVGVFIHQVTDVSWHSLVQGYKSHGLIKALAGLEFDGDYQSAHDYIDSLGDLLMLGQIIRDTTDNWSYYTAQDWEFPNKDDLLELAHRSGLDDLKFWEIKACVKRGSVALTSEVLSLLRRRKEVLGVAYNISPRARELMQDHWLGGEMNLVAMVNKCLPTFLSLFEKTSPLMSETELENFIELCGNLPSTGEASESIEVTMFEKERNEFLFVSPLTQLSLFGSDIAVGKFQNNEMSLAISAPLEDNEGSVYVIPWMKLVGYENLIAEKPVTSTYGSRVHKYTLGEIDYLAVSASGENTIHFYDNGHKVLSLVDKDSWERHQLMVSSVQDIDGDEVPDLILAGPHYGLNETGMVMIVDGRELSELLNDIERTEVDLQSLSTICLKAPLSKSFQQFGSQVKSSGVLNKSGMLFVGSQGLGVVFVYWLKSLHQNALPHYYIIDDNVIRQEEDVPLDLGIKKSSLHGMFGKEIHCWNIHGTGFVAISKHLQNTVYIYKEQDGFLEYYSTLVLDISTDARTVIETIGFGTSIDYDHNLNKLYISSPGFFDGDGAIWGIYMEEIQQSVEKWKIHKFLVTPSRHLLALNKGSGGKGISDFGKVIKVGPDGRIIVGVPRYGYGDFGKHQLAGGLTII